MQNKKIAVTLHTEHNKKDKYDIYSIYILVVALLGIEEVVSRLCRVDIQEGISEKACRSLRQAFFRLTANIDSNDKQDNNNNNQKQLEL